MPRTRLHKNTSNKKSTTNVPNNQRLPTKKKKIGSKYFFPLLRLSERRQTSECVWLCMQPSMKHTYVINNFQEFCHFCRAHTMKPKQFLAVRDTASTQHMNKYMNLQLGLTDSPKNGGYSGITIPLTNLVTTWIFIAAFKQMMITSFLYILNNSLVGVYGVSALAGVAHCFVPMTKAIFCRRFHPRNGSVKWLKMHVSMVKRHGNKFIAV